MRTHAETTPLRQSFLICCFGLAFLQDACLPVPLKSLIALPTAEKR
jgi:hypothetical protein